MKTINVFRDGKVDKEATAVFNACITIGGIEVRKHELADIIWQGVRFLSDEASELSNVDARKNCLLSRIKLALYIHYRLIGVDEDEIDDMVDSWIDGITGATNTREKGGIS